MTDNVLQSFCERCGTRYTFTEPTPAPAEESRGKRGLFGRRTSDEQEPTAPPEEPSATPEEEEPTATPEEEPTATLKSEEEPTEAPSEEPTEASEEEQPASGQGGAAPPDPATAGAEILESQCTQCHGLDRVTEAQKSPEEWMLTVTRMVGLGAELSPDQLGTLVGFLGGTYGP